MADSLIGSLRVALSLGTAEFEAGANKAAQISRAKAKEIEGAFSGAKAAVAGLFAAFTVGLLTEQVKKSLEYAGSIAEVARTLGLTTTQLQTYRYAASQTGVAQDQLEVGLRRLTVSMGKAELGSKDQAKAFAAIGISVDQLKGKNTGDVFKLMADGLSKVTDRSQRAAIEMILMGRSGSQLDNLLAPGSARLNELAQAAQRLGIVLSDSQIQGAEETAHKLAAVKEVLAAQIASVVASNANAILSLSSALATLTGEIAHFLGSNPQLALGIIGALLGGRAGGLPGAVLGGAAGALLGGKVQQSADDANTDLAFRTSEMRKAQAAYFSAQSTGGGPAMGVAGMQTGGGAPDTRNLKAEWIRQIGLLRQATAAATAPRSAAAPGVTPPPFLAGGGAHKRHPKDRNEDVEFQFAQAERQAEMEILQAKQALSHDYVERTTLSIQMLDLEKASRDAEIDHKVAQAKRDFAEGKITKATLDEAVREAAILKAKEVEVDHLKRQAVLDAEAEQRFQDIAQLDQQALEMRKGHLQDELALVTTAKERRDLELKILDIDYQIQKAKLEEVLADKQSSDQAKELARRALVDLNHEQGIKRQDVIQQTRGPLEQYMAGLPTSAAKWNEAIQNVAVQGFGSLEQAILDTLSGTKKLADAFREMAQSIISDLLRIAIQRMVIQPLANSLFGAIGGGGAGGVLDLTGAVPAFGGGGSGIVDLTGSMGAFPGLDDGGAFRVGGNAGTDRNVLSINGKPRVRVSGDETIAVIPRGGYSGLPGMAHGGILSVLGPALFGLSGLFASKAIHEKSLKPLLGLISPLGYLAMSGGKGFNPLALLSPGLFLASQLLDHHKHAAQPLGYASSSAGGHTFNFNINAPNSGNAAQDRRTSLQQASDIRMEIADASRKGLL